MLTVACQESFMLCDGLYDIHQQLALSGEPLIPQLAESFKQVPPQDLLDMHRLAVEGLAEEIKFNDYWNSTANDDGQVVDAVIMPCAPSAALVPGKYRHLGTVISPSPSSSSSCHADARQVTLASSIS
jgi:amidase